jgi:hypothetical protein
VHGVVLKEGVAVVLSLTSALGSEATVDLVEDVGSVLDSFLAEMLESMTSGCTSEDLEDLVVEKVTLVDSVVSGASSDTGRNGKGDSDSGELNFSDHDEFRCKGGKVKGKKRSFVKKMFR